ncbi:MAG: Dabb family protein [Candidatus Anammoximicrobium sp.]|mgnify:CR=1 FL=1|nr:Dabb family protein [Candidatus Anammoximicrobium sp.]
MRRLPAGLVTALLLLIPTVAATHAADRQLAHAVYFKLKDSAPAGRDALVAGCQKFLTGHEGTVYFAVGVLAEELKREVNVRDYDVALYLVFANKAAHDQYASHPRHMKFIEEFKSSWENVRVFDAYLAPAKLDTPR